MSRRGQSTVEDQEQEDGHHHSHDLDDGIQRKDGCFSSSKRAKKLLLVPFTRLRSLYRHNNNKKKRNWWWRCMAPPPAPFPYSEDMGKDCCYCFMQPPASPPSPLMPADSKASPGHVSYTEFVKEMVERNDFYSPDCNPHREPKT